LFLSIIKQISLKCVTINTPAMKLKKILIVFSALILACQVWAQKKNAHKVQNESGCINNVYATPSAIEAGLNTTLQFLTSDTVFTISWSPAASLTNPDSVVTFAHPGVTTTYTVTGTTSCGAFTDTVTVFIQCMVAVNLITTPSYCPADAGTAEAVAWQGLAPYYYSWSAGQTTTKVNGLTPGKYWVTVKDSDQCSVSDTFAITTKPITATASATLLTIEPGDSTLLGAAANEPGLSYTVSWAPSSSVRKPKAIYTYASPTVSTTYTVTMNTPCGTFTDTVTVHTGCSVTASIATTPFYCTADGGIAASNVSTGVPPYAYSWSNGQTSARITGLSTGTYSLTVKDSYGCSTYASAKIDSSLMAIAIYASNYSLKPGDSVFFYTVINDSASSSHTYSWMPSSSVTNPDSLATYAHPMVTTIYTVTASSSCGYITDTVTIHVSEPTGLKTLMPDLSALSIYPNPGNGIFTISYSLVRNENVNMTVIDEFGRLVYEQQFNNSDAGVHEQVLNIANVEEGLYSLKLLTDDGIETRRFMVLRDK